MDLVAMGHTMDGRTPVRAGDIYSLTFKDSMQARVPVLSQKELLDQKLLNDFAREKRAAMRQGGNTAGPAATMHRLDEISGAIISTAPPLVSTKIGKRDLPRSHLASSALSQDIDADPLHPDEVGAADNKKLLADLAQARALLLESQHKKSPTFPGMTFPGPRQGSREKSPREVQVTLSLSASRSVSLPRFSPPFRFHPEGRGELACATWCGSGLVLLTLLGKMGPCSQSCALSMYLSLQLPPASTASSPRPIPLFPPSV